MKEKFKFKEKIEDVSPEEVKKQQQGVIKLQMPEIVTLDFLYGEGGEITYEYPEMTALCPMTGIQDFYTLRIVYIPDEKIPELKSLRLYFMAYRDIPILHEHLANKIFEDFMRTVRPEMLRVELEVAVRGGIYTSIVRES